MSMCEGLHILQMAKRGSLIYSVHRIEKNTEVVVLEVARGSVHPSKQLLKW